jgi:hypothetical protein
MRESQRTSPMNFQFTMVQARAASADGLSSRCGLVRESDGNSPFGKFGRSPAAPSGGIVSATPISTHTYLESSVHLLWQKPTWPGAVTGRQPFPVQNRSKSEACGPSTECGVLKSNFALKVSQCAWRDGLELTNIFHFARSISKIGFGMDTSWSTHNRGFTPFASLTGGGE